MEPGSVQRQVRKCPYCAEEVKPAAVVCKHCGRGIVPPEWKALCDRWREMSQDERDTASAKFTPQQQLMFQASWRELGYENEGLAKPKRRLRLALLCFIVALAIGGVFGFLVFPGQRSTPARRSSALPGATAGLRAAERLDKEAQRRISTGVAEPVTQRQRSIQKLAPLYAPPVPAGPSMSDMYAQRERCYKTLLPIWRESNTTLDWSGGTDLAFRSPLAASIPKVLLDSGTMTKLADICYFESVTLTDNRGYFAHYDLPLSATAIAEIRGY